MIISTNHQTSPHQASARGAGRSLVRGLCAAATAAMMLVGASGAQAGSLSTSHEEIDAGVNTALNELVQIRPDARTLLDKAAGVLVIPEVTKAGLVVGGAYGEGALLVHGVTDSYWSYAAASLGYQLGAQQTRQVMFFMTQDALDKFETSNGFEVGADAEVTVIDQGGELAVDSTEADKPIIVLVFGREGLLAGASLQGGKYSRLDD